MMLLTGGTRIPYAPLLATPLTLTLGKLTALTPPSALVLFPMMIVAGRMEMAPYVALFRMPKPKGMAPATVPRVTAIPIPSR